MLEGAAKRLSRTNLHKQGPVTIWTQLALTLT